MKRKKPPAAIPRNLSRSSVRQAEAASPASLPTFMDHVRELQWRLAVVALAFLLAGAAAYPFFGQIVALLLKPLGQSQQLVYLTPGGGFSFIIQVCIYIGLIGALPVILYNLYRFVMPAVQKVALRRVLAYSLASLVLAIIGVVFAYSLSLPAALHFLTNFDLQQINPMLTADSYLSFVMTYLLAGALLFQLPLVMLIINRVTPLTPRKLMGAQRHIILGSFVVAAIISPTPDAVNQLLLAAPVVVMYQLGIIMIWLGNRRRTPARATQATSRPVGELATVEEAPARPTGYAGRAVSAALSAESQPGAVQPKCAQPKSPQPVAKAPLAAAPSRRRSMDGFVMAASPCATNMKHAASHQPSPSTLAAPRPATPRRLAVPARRPQSAGRTTEVPARQVRSLDGFLVPARL